MEKGNIVGIKRDNNKILVLLFAIYLNMIKDEVKSAADIITGLLELVFV